MLGRRNRKINSAAASALPPIERKTTINQAAPNPAWLVFSVSIVGLIVLFLAWRFLIYAFDVLGYYDPEQAAVEFLVILLIGAIILIVSIYLAKHLAKMFLDHLKEMKELDIELTKHQLALASSVPPQATAGMTSENKFKARLIQAIIYLALNTSDWIDDDGRVVGNTLPWSRRSVRQVTIDGEVPTETMAAFVPEWLRKNGFLLGDRQLNFGRYGDRGAFLGAVQERLWDEFGRVSFKVNDTLSLEGYVPIPKT